MAVMHKVETKNGVVEKKLTRQKAIRLKCLECSGWSLTEVRNCTCINCALFPYRGTVNSQKILLGKD